MKIAALDIETDTSPLSDAELAAGYTTRGLDPRITPITAISLTTDEDTTVFDTGSEREILETTTEAIATYKPVVLGTWNGAVFDLPFIVDRAKLYNLPTGITLKPNPLLVPKYQPTPGHDGGYDAYWHTATHIDVAYVYKDFADITDVKWSLKPVAKAHGLQPVEVDRTKMHELTEDQLRAYVASDAEVTYALLKRALGF